MSGVYRVEVRVVAPVQDTEVPERVADAILALFPDAEITHEEGRVVARTRSLGEFSKRLHQQAILDTARERMFAGQYGDAVHFDLRKGPASQGVVNFTVDDPGELGDLQVRIGVDKPDVESFVDQVAPPTEGGEPVTDRDE